MKDDKTPKWERFEKLIATIQQSLAPSAEVIHDHEVLGKNSKKPRQIDVAIRQRVGQFDLLIVIECKDHKEPVDISQIEAFIGKLKDIGANKGAFVSASGFSEAAKLIAKEAGIDLYRLIDTEKHDWQTYVSCPVMCDFRGIAKTQFCFRSSLPGPCRIPTVDEKRLILYKENGSVIDTVFNMLVNRWNSGSLPSEPGTYTDIKLEEYPTSVKCDGVLYHLDVYISIEVRKRLFFGQVSISDIQGFFDEQTKGVITKGLQFGIDVTEVEKKWMPVKNIKELAVKPVFSLKFLDNYPLVKIPE